MGDENEAKQVKVSEERCMEDKYLGGGLRKGGKILRMNRGGLDFGNGGGGG